MTPAAREWLAITGFDPAYGARPLRRLVQREIGDRLARALLEGVVRDGGAAVIDRDPDADTLRLVVAGDAEQPQREPDPGPDPDSRMPRR